MCHTACNIYCSIKQVVICSISIYIKLYCVRFNLSRLSLNIKLFTFCKLNDYIRDKYTVKLNIFTAVIDKMRGN